MVITFLGTGTSQGVPMIAHDSAGLDLGDVRNWRTRASVHVEMDGWHVQVDAAPEFRLQCLHNDVRRVDTFVLTHGHADHVMGMDDLRRFCDLNGFTALPVYASEEGLQRVREVFPYAIAERPMRKGYPAFDLRAMPPELELPGGWVRAALLPHGAIEVLGLVFEEKSSGRKLAYFTDCKEVTPEARALAEGCEVVVLDALRPEPHPSHMSVEEALAAAADLGAGRAFLTHFTFQMDHATWSAKMPAGVELAYDGLRVEV